MYSTKTTAMRFSGVRDALELEAVVQEVFARAFAPRNLLAYDGVRPFGAFLKGIARNIVLDMLRRNARHGEVLTAPEEIDSILPAHRDVPEDEKRGGELVATFLASQCDDRDRTLYALRYQRELSQVEAGTAARLTRIQIRRWEHDFRLRLMRFLKRSDYVRDP